VLVYVMEAEDVKRAYAAYGASSLPIDEEHRAVLAEVLAEPLQIEPLYDCSAA
jgi:1-deoxy-D-xylulose 5-phosphate reductoisomerase